MGRSVETVNCDSTGQWLGLPELRMLASGRTADLLDCEDGLSVWFWTPNGTVHDLNNASRSNSSEWRFELPQITKRIAKYHKNEKHPAHPLLMFTTKCQGLKSFNSACKALDNLLPWIMRCDCCTGNGGNDAGGLDECRTCLFLFRVACFKSSYGNTVACFKSRKLDCRWSEQLT